MSRARNVANLGDGIVTADIGDGQITTAKFASGAITDAVLPAGSVIQVVQGTYSTQVISSSTSPVDTGLSASITPSSASNKILVMVSHPNSDKRNGDAYITMYLFRDASNIYTPSPQFFFTQNSEVHSAGIAFSYLDSPSTTSSVTYKTTFFNGNGSTGQVSMQWNNDTSTIILMEIAG